jgi:hypothetical protein
MPENARSALASKSVARHFARGAIGFGLIGAALALASSLGMAALRLIQTISAGRVERTCAGTACALNRTDRQTSSIGSTSVRTMASSRSPASAVRRSSTM